MKIVHSSKRRHYVAAISIFLIFSVTAALISGMAGCNGPEHLQIRTWYDLDAIRNNLDADHELMNDLDATTAGYEELASPTANGGKGWQPIGIGAKPFKGTFDGGGNTISDLFIYRPDEDEVGLFGRVQEGLVKHVGLVSVNVTGNKSVGALVGYNWKGKLDSDTRPPYSKTYSHGSVTGEEDVGGLVGNNYDGTVNQCESSAEVFQVSSAPDEERWRAGGLVGLNGGTVSNCDYNGAVNGDRQVGGLVGHNALIPEGRVEDCGGAYSVHGNLEVGGVAGRNLGALRRNSYTGKVNGILTVIGDGLTALNEGATGNADSSDTALPGSYVGGVVGVNEGTVEDCSAEATVEGYQYVGGLAGANNGTVEKCNSSGDVTGNSDVGRLVGYNKGTVSNSESTSCVTGAIDCGPLVGRNEGVIEGEEEVEIPCKNPGMFVQMTIGDPETLDPAAAYDTASGEQISYVYEPLIMYKGTESAGFVGVLATEWMWNSADLTWRFKIRKGVKFHEGGDLTPSDVEYSFERAMIYDRLGGPAWMLFEPLLLAGEYAGLTFADVDAAVEVDGDYVVFKLADAGYKLIFLQTLCGSWGSILDKEWCVTKGEWDGTEADAANHYQAEDGTTYLWTHMNGTGPWKLNLWDRGVQVKLEKFAGYWRDPAPFDWVITQIVNEWTTRKQALLAGDVDFVLVDALYYSELDGIADLNVYRDLPELMVTGFFMVMNISQTSPYIGSGKLDGNGIPGNFFTDKDVRKGFCYAFDYDKFITEVMTGNARQPETPVVKGLYGYNPNASKYTLDLGKAKTHFQAAFGGQVWEKGFKFIILYNSGNMVRKGAMEILQKNLLAINPKFQVAIQPLAWGTGILPLLKTKSATTYIIGWMADFPHADNFVRPFMTTYGTYAKYQSYGSAELDAKISAALLEPDPAKQLEKYYELQQIFYDDVPGFMISQPLSRRYFTKYIDGFYFNPMIAGQAGPVYYMSKSQS